MKRVIAVLASTEDRYRHIARSLRDEYLTEPSKTSPGYSFSDSKFIIRRVRRYTDVQGLRCYQLVKYDDFYNAPDAEQIIRHWEMDNQLYKKDKRRRVSWWQWFKGLFK